MSIAFGSSSTSSFTSGTSHTFSHSTSGSNRILFVIACTNVGSDVVTGVTYAGVSMSFVVKRVDSSNNRYLYIYQLVAPATGSNNVVISTSSSVAITGVASSYTGASQTSPIDASTSGSFTSSPETTTLTTTTNNCWAILASADASSVACSASTNSTYRTASTGFPDVVLFDSNSAITPAGSFSMTITGGSPSVSFPVITVMAAFKPVAPVVTFDPMSICAF